jgi:twitching motility protein PilT
MAWRNALAAAETGSRVICTLPYMDLENSFERLSEKVETQGEVGLARLVSVTQVALNLRLMEGLDSAHQPAVEILVLQREIREKIKRHQWSDVFQSMFQLGEKTGMRTLNQCLMNLMLKRKIDFKVGFSESPNPDELDLMLERIGV